MNGGSEHHHQMVRQRIQDFIRRKNHFNRMNSLEMTTVEPDTHPCYAKNNEEEEDENNTLPLPLDISNPIADDFDNTSIMFADITNFTYWSSLHSPNEVFTLLESIFFEFDRIANEMGVYKLSTVGDCYIAVTGVPYPCVSVDGLKLLGHLLHFSPFTDTSYSETYISTAPTTTPKQLWQENHAIILTQFAELCKRKANEVMTKLNTQKNLNTEGLQMRIGIHSGPVTAGVLRGDKARFDLFGDTINTAARIESTGKPNCIHLSLETARLIEEAGRGDWLEFRRDSVKAKGKGELKTFWLKSKGDVYFSDDAV